MRRSLPAHLTALVIAVLRAELREELAAMHRHALHRDPAIRRHAREWIRHLEAEDRILAERGARAHAQAQSAHALEQARHHADLALSLGEAA